MVRKLILAVVIPGNGSGARTHIWPGAATRAGMFRGGHERLERHERFERFGHFHRPLQRARLLPRPKWMSRPLDATPSGLYPFVLGADSLRLKLRVSPDYPASRDSGPVLRGGAS